MAKFSLLAKIGIDTKALAAGLKTAKGRIKSFSKTAGASFLRMGAAFAGVGLVKSIMSLGLAAGETASKFKAVFGPATAKMAEEVDKLRETIPSTKAEMQDALATFAAMGKAFGLNAKAAGIFSVEMVKVAGDIASFHNLPIEEAFGKIRAAVAGEFEGLKQLGIVINEARLKQEALNTGIWDGVGNMNAAQKAIAVQSIMIRDLGEANGDAAATADSAANQVKFLKKSLTETATEIGTTMLPAVAMLTKALATMISGIKGGMEAMGDFISRQIYMSGLSDVEFEAKLELESSGAFEKAGVDRVGMGAARTAMIKKRAKEIEKEREIEAKAEEERQKSAEVEIKNSEDLEKTLEDQIATETDPKRAQALKDRLAAYQELIKAAGDMEGLDNGGEGSKADPEEEKKKNLEALEKKINEMKLKAIHAQANGDKEAQAAMERRAKFAQKILDLMKEYNISQEQATLIANKIAKPGDLTGEEKSSLTGHDLKKASNLAGKGKGENGEDIRFEKLGSGGFQQYIGGKKGKMFSEAEMQAGLQNQIDKDPTEALLEKINATLEGKFVSQ